MSGSNGIDGGWDDEEEENIVEWGTTYWTTARQPPCTICMSLQLTIL